MEETAAASPSNETGTVLQRLSRPLRDLDWKEARDAAANGVQKAVASTVEGMERATKALRESIGGRHSDQIARAVVVGSATTAVALLIYGSSKLLRGRQHVREAEKLRSAIQNLSNEGGAETEGKREAKVRPRRVSDSVPASWGPSLDELSAFVDNKGPALIAIDGVVYDITPSAYLYTAGGPFEGLLGRDVTLLIAKAKSIEGTKLMAKRVGSRSTSGAKQLSLSEEEKKTVEYWKDHIASRYKAVGRLKGYQQKSSQSSEEQQEVARPTNPSPSLPSAKRPLFVDDEENDSMAEPTKSDEKTAEANDVEEAVKVEATDRVVGDAPKESEQKDSKTKESEEKDSEKKDKEKPNEEEKALKSKPERPAVSVAPIAVPTELSPQPSPQASPSAKLSDQVQCDAADGLHELEKYAEEFEALSSYLARHPLQKSPSTVSPQNRSSLLWRYARAGAEALWAREHCKRAKGIIAVEVVEERENKAAIAELLDCADKAVILSSGCGEGARWYGELVLLAKELDYDVSTAELVRRDEKALALLDSAIERKPDNPFLWELSARLILSLVHDGNKKRLTKFFMSSFGLLRKERKGSTPKKGGRRSLTDQAYHSAQRALALIEGKQTPISFLVTLAMTEAARGCFNEAELTMEHARRLVHSASSLPSPETLLSGTDSICKGREIQARIRAERNEL